MIRISKSDCVIGKNLEFRNVCVHNAHFIHSLRLDAVKGLHISKSSSDVQDQIKWLEKYEKSKKEAYFLIIDCKSQQSIGTVRIYDPLQHPSPSFCWGSWILTHNAPSYAAIESALMIYEYGYDYLGFTSAHFDIRKKNNSVWKFHERMGAIKIKETECDYFYYLPSFIQKEKSKKYKRYLPNKIKVIPKL